MTESSPRFTLLTAARLVDGSGAPPVPQAALLVENGRVVKMGRAAEVRAPGGAAVDRRDYSEATILPGLVDAHPHPVAPGDCTVGGAVANEDGAVLVH